MRKNTESELSRNLSWLNGIEINAAVTPCDKLRQAARGIVNVIGDKIRNAVYKHEARMYEKELISRHVSALGESAIECEPLDNSDNFEDEQFEEYPPLRLVHHATAPRLIDAEDFLDDDFPVQRQDSQSPEAQKSHNQPLASQSASKWRHPASNLSDLC